MALKRRAFLRRVCLTLAGLGLSETRLIQISDRYRQVLAQPTARKLALLIGINQYGKAPGLNGCLTDVELQRQLLLHRFGFQASDIVTLTDQKATRSNIEATFISHLIEQARPGDVVVFHFSGYGRQVRLTSSPTDTRPGALNEHNALVPVDGVLSNGSTSEKSVSNDLLDDTLLLLLRSLQTDQITTILDTSYLYPGSALLGNLRIRARPRLESGQANAAELVLREQLLQQTGLSSDQLRVQRQSNQTPGIFLAAAKPLQTAAEAQWHGFNAGLFTYALTQHLWNTTPATTIWTSLSQVATAVEQRVGKEQQPTFSGQKSSQTLLFPYDDQVLGTSADGVVISVDDGGKTGKVWLSGLPPEVLEVYSPGAVLTVLSLPPVLPLLSAAATTATPDADAIAALSPLETQSGPLPIPVTPSDTEATAIVVEPAAVGAALATDDERSQSQHLQLQSLNGLMVKGQLDKGWLQIGQPVQEAIRVLPRTIGLTVALDSCLERIERVDATSAFSTLSHISPVTAGEQPADCLFAKLLTTKPLPNATVEESGSRHTLVSEAAQPYECSYGLFSVGKELLPSTLGSAGEAIKAAVRRLNPQLQVLLSAKLLGLIVNDRSSRLGASVTLEMVSPEPQVLIQQETTRAPWLSPTATSASLSKTDKTGGVVTIPTGSRIQYRIHNYSEHPLHLFLFGVDSSASAFTLYALATPDNPDQPRIQPDVIAPGTTLTLPHLSHAFDWIVHGPTGLATTYLVLSRQPLNRVLGAIATVSQQKASDAQQLVALPNGIEIVQEVLQDLHQASEAAAVAAGISNEWLAFDVNCWATFRFTYRII